MKQKCIKYITIILIAIVILTSIPLENLIVFAYPDTEAEFKTYLDNEGLSYTSFGNWYAANFNTFNIYGLVVYGSPHGDTKYSNITGRNERRYLGYDYNNNPYTNNSFPNDATSGRPPEKWSFIKIDNSYESWRNISADLKNYMLTTKLQGHGATTLTVNSIGGTEYAKIQSLPTLKNDGSIYIQHKTSDGKVWYATFIVPAMGYDTDIEGVISTPSNIFTMESNQDSITVPITVQANAKLMGSYTKSHHIASITASYHDQKKTDYGVTTTSTTKNLNLKRSDYGDGTHTIALEGKAEMESIYQDKYIAKPKKNITLVVKPKGANSISTTATANPSEVKFSNADINVQVNVQSFLNGYSNLTNISHWKFYAKKAQDSTEQEVTVNASVLSAIGAFNFTIPKSAITGDNYTQVFNTRGKVFFKDGTSMEAPASTSTYVYKILGNNPVAVITAQDEIKAGESLGFSGSKSYDIDGEIVDYSWSMAGSDITISENKKTGSVTFNSIGNQTIGLTVTDNDGLTGSTSKQIKVLPPTPTATIKIIGTPKENRKIILDANSSYTPEKYPMKWEATKWQITPISGGTATDIKYSGTLTGTATKDILIKKSGTYKISLTVTNSAGYSDTKEMTQFIEVDQNPVVDFTTITTLYRDPENMNKAIIEIVGTGYSPDGDILKHTKVEYAYDSNNNGSFTDEIKIALDHVKLNNEGKIQFDAYEVGKYKVWLYGEEEFGQPTIPSFITSADIKKADTLNKPDSQAVIEVANLAPTVDFAIQGKRKVDLYINKATDMTMAQLQSKVNSIILPVIQAENIDANIIYNDGGSVSYGDIVVSSLSTTFRKANGEIWGAGHGQNLGFGWSYAYSTYPTIFKSPAIDNVVGISQGSLSGHRFFLNKESNGNISSYGVGEGWEYQLGTSGSSRTNVVSPYPAPASWVLDHNNIEFIRTGGQYTSYAKMKDGKVYGWGWNRFRTIKGESDPTGVFGDKIPVPEVVTGLPTNKTLVDIQATNECAFFLYDDGTVYRSGHNVAYGVDFPPVQITKISNAKAISPLNIYSGGARLSVLKADGTVWLYSYDRSWGDIATRDSFTQQAGLSNIIKISTGYPDYQLFLRNDGKVLGTGDNSFGQLGNGNTNWASAPVEAFGLKDIVKIKAGYGSSFAVDKDGNVYSWGNNQYGQLGTGNYNSQYTPYKIPNFSLKHTSYKPLKDVITNISWRNDAEHFFVNLNDAVLTELDNQAETGQILVDLMKNEVNFIGLGKTTNKTQIEELVKKNDSKGKYIDNTNIDIALQKLVNHIAYRILVDLNINIGITTQGDISSIQSKINLLLKPKLEAHNIDAKINAINGSEIKYGDVISTERSTILKLANGSMMASGYAMYHGLLGSDILVDTSSFIKSGYYGSSGGSSLYKENVVNISKGSSARHVMVIDENENNYTFGYNNMGQMGNGTITDTTGSIYYGNNQLIINNNMKNINKIITSSTSMIIIANDGKIYGTGENKWYQLGLANTTPPYYDKFPNPTLIPLPPNTKIVDGSIGTRMSALVTDTGKLFYSGVYYYSMYGGSQAYNVFTETSYFTHKVKKVAVTGSDIVYVLLEDNKVWKIVGRNAPVQLNPTNVIDIQAGYNHGLFLLQDGTVYAEGDNTYGQFGIGTTSNYSTPMKVSSLSDVIFISAGLYWNHAIKKDGSLWAWGVNGEFGAMTMYQGVLGDGTTTNKYTPVKVSGINLLQKNNVNLADIINDIVYRPTANHYFVNLNDSINPELNTASTNGIADNLKLDEVRYITLGTNANLSQVEQFLSANEIQGSFISNTNIDTALNQLADYIIETAMRNRRTDKYVLLDEELEYITYYADKENDPKHDEKWKFTHEPTHFENDLGLHGQSNIELKQPIRAFNKTGKYEAIYQAQDNPKNKAEFNPYWLWSDKNLTDYFIYVHRAPIPEFDLYPVINTATGKYVFYIVEKSYDIDHLSKTNKGIVRKVWKWKELNETEWHKGIIPNEQDSSKMYLIQLDVQDEEGVWASTTKLVDKAVEMPLDFTATLTPSYPTGIPASENVTIDVDVFSPIDVTEVKAQLEGETTIVTLTKTGQNEDNTHKYYRGTYTIPATKLDNKDPVIDFYKMFITVKNVLNKVISKDYKVKVSTPINLIPNMPTKSEAGATINVAATTTKYANNVTATLFKGKSFVQTITLTGTLSGNNKNWIKSFTIPANISDGTYTAEFVATTPNGNTEKKEVNFVVESLQVNAILVPNPALAGDELIFTVETKGYVERIEIDVDADIIVKDDRIGKYNYPTLKFNVNGLIDEKKDVLRYILSVKTEQTLTKDNVRLRPQYTFKVRGYKGSNFKEVELKLDVRRSVLDLLHPGVKTN